MITIRDWIATIPDTDKHIAYVGEENCVFREFLLTGTDWKVYRNWTFYLDMAFDLSSVTKKDSKQVVTTQQDVTETVSENQTENNASTTEPKANSSEMTGQTQVKTSTSGKKETYTVETVQVDAIAKTDVAYLMKTEKEDGLHLRWKVEAQQTRLPGKLTATIRAMGLMGEVKKSALMVFEVDPAVVAEPAAPINRNTFELMMAEMNTFVEAGYEQVQATSANAALAQEAAQSSVTASAEAMVAASEVAVTALQIRQTEKELRTSALQCAANTQSAQEAAQTAGAHMQRAEEDAELAAASAAAAAASAAAIGDAAATATAEANRATAAAEKAEQHAKTVSADVSVVTQAANSAAGDAAKAKASADAAATAQRNAEEQAEDAASDASVASNAANAATAAAQSATQYAEQAEELVRQAQADMDVINQGGLLLKDAYIAEQINRWLSDHPEASTSVADHSLTVDKLVVGTLGYVTPQMFGAKGDGVTDDTAAIQAAMDAHHNVYIPGGKYVIDGAFGGWGNIDTKGGIRLSGGQRVYMAADCEIRVKDNPNSFYHAFVVSGCSNVEIHGGKIVGDGKAHEGTHGYGIHIMNSDHVLIDNVDISYMNADGIILSTPTELEGHNSHITIRDCSFHDCRRQGISVVVGDNVLISNCKFHNISGAAPQSGIDLEPNSNVGEDMYLHHITIENCRFVNNVQSMCFSKCDNLTVNNCQFAGGWDGSSDYPGRIVAEGNASNVKFNNCSMNTFIANRNSDVTFYGCDIALVNNQKTGDSGLKGVTRYYDCRFSGEMTGTTASGCKRAVISGNGEMYFKNCDFTLAVQTAKDTFVYGSAPCHFDNCTFVSTPAVLDAAEPEVKTYPEYFIVAGDCEFNHCRIASSFGGAYPHMFNNPTRLVMQNCHIETNEYVIMYSVKKVDGENVPRETEVFAVGNVFDCAKNVMNIPTIVLFTDTSTFTFANNVYTTPATPLSAGGKTVTDVNNHKI